MSTLGRPVAGKTGTAGLDDDIISAWFVAYTKQISTSVMWVAGDSGTSGLDAYKRPGDSTFFGGTYPAMTWTDYMRVAVKGTPIEQFEDPAFVNSRSRQATRPRNTVTNRPASTPSLQPTQAPTPSQAETTPADDNGSENGVAEESPEPAREPEESQPTETAQSPTRAPATTRGFQVPTPAIPTRGSAPDGEMDVFDFGD